MNSSLGEDSRTPGFWRPLIYFNIYRVVIATLFLLSFTVDFFVFQFDFGVQNATLFRTAAYFYLMASGLSLVVLAKYRRHFGAQLAGQVLIDIAVFLALMYASGGGRSGFGGLLLVSLAASALVGEGRIVLFYAALATIGVLGLQVQQTLASELDPAAFLRVSVLSLAFFATALLGRLLASRVVASEALARRRGEDLRKQLRLTSRVIAMLDDGVLVVAPDGRIAQANPRARQLLRLQDEQWGNLARLGESLASAFRAWRTRSVPERLDFSPPWRSDLVLNAHFVDVPDAGGDALVFLQDVGESREHERRMKLAALGRLTAGIAHEIRNPLSSIRHAAELLREDDADPSARRLLQIVLDNAQRLERIVRDVLELGRRDSAAPQDIALDGFLVAFLNDFLTTAGWPRERVELRIGPKAAMHFDPAHLRQVLWNLVANAGRYASDAPGAICLIAEDRPARLSVDDDGPGVPGDELGRLFEPFHTTSKDGNGLGLYIARELCEANGARLVYAPRNRGACFVILRGN